ncbi:MAG: hypothetical protein D4R65_01535 [Verrucomicrobiaceae bacterium]|nr:MAG: hypothetical protein D4R65_01535 [Verrucomicrobiaceae bacterium]
MKTSLAILCLFSTAALVSAKTDKLADGFQSPPASAKPHTWWHWMNGNITKEGLTADLEAMARVGIGGAQIFNVGSGIPAGPVKFLGPEWRELMQHAAKEADRLGVELCLHNCPGWSSSGGPWNTPENAMKQLALSETTLKGPSHFSGTLPQPRATLDFYRDIEVLAFPTPAGEEITMQSLSPKVTGSQKDISGDRLFDANPATFATLPLPAEGRESFLQFEFPKPFPARSALVVLGSNARGSRGVVQVSDDGLKFRDLQPFSFPRNSGDNSMWVSLGANPAPAKFYRVKFAAGGLNAKQIDVAEVSFSPALRTGDVLAKSGMNMGSTNAAVIPVTSAVEPGLAVNFSDIIDLTAKMKPDGSLDWDVPAGQWTVVRIGQTLTGKENHPAPEGGEGLECDKLSAEAMDAHWAGFVQKIIDDLGPLAGKGKAFNNVLIDSYEVGGQNWTTKFREEFQKRRGYDPLPWLVTVTGRVVDNPEVTERFLWDMRRTAADLFAEKYYERFRQLCSERGLTASIEPYTGPFESLQCGAAAEIPMGEFWVRSEPHSSLKLASSVGHIYGRPIIGAESFTAAPSADHGRWLDDPYALKALGDLVFCQGINRYIFHRYAMQPWMNRWPGMTMGQWGSHFDRTCTWWNQGAAWMKYIARCQFLLQQGVFAADAAAFCGESAPVQMPAITPALPPGYDYDGINADVLLNQASMKDGRLVLKSGVSYRLLALSQPDRTMTPGLLRKLRDFVSEGLTLVGPPPEKSPGLGGYPKCDEEVKSLVSEIWGNCDGSSVTEHRLGKGRVFWGQTMEQILAALEVKPDLEFSGESRLAFIHRTDGDADIYFVSNQRDRFDSVDCTFRVAGKIPEFWHPDSGRMEQAPVWREESGRTIVPVTFDPAGSVFVVFRKKSGEHIVSATFSDSSSPVAARSELVITKARYESEDDNKMAADVTATLNGMVRDGILKIAVNNRAFGGDPAPMHKKQLRLEYVLNGVATEKIALENAVLEIGLPAVASEPPPLKLVSNTDGQVALLASAPGAVELKTSSGKTLRAEVNDVPKPLKVSGPWELNFPLNWGAPAKVTLPELISWTAHSDNGVKYFSGTATYVKNVEIPEELFGKGNSLWLNLGNVKNLAEVSVNGKPLGVLWKPPFRADITEVAKPGKNSLEIKVTNLWPNRLIGDEQLPPDCEWSSNGAIKEWPQWLLEGKPSPTGRFTFTTWHHWKKSDKPLTSGLLGPVTVSAAVKVSSH